MAQLDKTFPTGDCAMCILSPKLVECARNKNIEIITLADDRGHQRRARPLPGRSPQRNPRYVDLEKCNACGDCAEACPVSLPNEFDRGLGTRKAVYPPVPAGHPQRVRHLQGRRHGALQGSPVRRASTRRATWP